RSYKVGMVATELLPSQLMLIGIMFSGGLSIPYNWYSRFKMAWSIFSFAWWMKIFFSSWIDTPLFSRHAFIASGTCRIAYSYTLRPFIFMYLTRGSLPG